MCTIWTNLPQNAAVSRNLKAKPSTHPYARALRSAVRPTDLLTAIKLLIGHHRAAGTLSHRLRIGSDRRQT